MSSDIVFEYNNNDQKDNKKSIVKQNPIVEQLDFFQNNIINTQNLILQYDKLNEIYLNTNIKNIKTKKLGDVCKNIKTGKNKPNDNKQGILYPYYDTGGITGYTDEYLVDGEYILVNRNSTIRQVLFITDKSFPSDHIFIIKETDLNIRYLYFVLKYLNNLSNDAHGAIIPGITKENLTNLDIPIPSIEIQNKIVEYHDNNNNLIIKLNKVIDSNKLLMKDIITNL